MSEEFSRKQRARRILPWLCLVALLLVTHLRDEADRRRPPGHQSGTTAVAWISTFARSSISAATWTTAIGGKCRPMTAR